MSLNSEDTAAIIAAAEKSGNDFYDARVVRFMKAYMYLKSVIDSKELANFC